MKAELDAIHANTSAHKAKRDAINQSYETLSQAKGRREHREKKSATAEYSPHQSNQQP